LSDFSVNYLRLLSLDLESEDFDSEDLDEDDFEADDFAEDELLPDSLAEDDLDEDELLFCDAEEPCCAEDDGGLFVDWLPGTEYPGSVLVWVRVSLSV
jgi:hypothetical protein